MKGEMLIIALCGLLCAGLFSGCSFKLEFGYHGETAIDNQNYTGGEKRGK